MRTSQPTPARLLSDADAILNRDLDDRFDRLRCWSPRSVTLALLLMTHPTLRAGYQVTIDRMSDVYGAALGWSEDPNPSTLCRARAKLSEDTLRSIHARWLDSPGGKAAAQRGLFRGFRICALDGMSAILPDTEELDATFGRVRTGKGDARHPSALVVTLWDAGACLPLDWVVARGRSGERVAAMQFFDNLQEDDLLVGDRGFPSRRILVELAARERHFLFRMVAGTRADWPEVAAFLASGKRQDEVVFTYKDPDAAEPLTERFRLLRKQRGGRLTVLVTSVLDRKRLDWHDAIDAYAMRWCVETAFRTIKMRYELEDFHGQNALFVRQEIAVVMIHLAMEACIEATATIEAGIPPQTDLPAEQRQLCNRRLLARRIETLLDIFSEMPKRRLLKRLRRGLALCVRRRQRVRPGRSFDRVCKGQFGRWRMAKRAA